ncbi:MAG: methyltransferase domain-containing protein [Alphaproteobacteria bacterium]|nr:methyltransferase domain-containing protein [Alphaproteobacteria bacterium]
MPAPPQVFDRRAVRRHRERAAPGLSGYDFLVGEVAERLADCLPDIKRTFPMALDLGCHTGQVASVLKGRGGIEWLAQCDLSPAMVSRAPAAAGPRLVLDEEALPFADGRFDLILSVLSLHWVNDLPGTLLQIRRALKPDGLFLCAILGGGTLGELRQSLLAAEVEVKGGASPRVSPFVDPHDAGALLQRAGFALPVVDTDRIVLSYSDPFAMMAELRGLGEANAVAERQRTFTPRAVIDAGARHYFQNHADEDGRIPASFQIITLTGWAPHESQQQPLERGSGQTPLSDALG